MKKLPDKSRTVSRVVAAPVGADEILPEYDFSNGMRNKYASQYSARAKVRSILERPILLGPDSIKLEKSE